MECRKIIITRLRNSEYYTGEPLNHIVDSIYHLLNNYIKTTYKWPFTESFTIDTHNCSLPVREKTRADIEIIKELKMLMH